MIEQRHPEPDIAIHQTTTDHLVVKYPGLLRIEESAEAEGVDLVLTASSTGLPFRPNIVFTSVLSAAPLIDASLAAIVSAGEQHPGARPVSVDVFYGPHASVEDVPIGRVFSFTYPATKMLDVMVKRWVIATGEHHLHLSASFLPSQALVVEETFDWIAANLDFAASTRSLRAAAIGQSTVGVRLDDDATVRAGFPLEDLTDIAVPKPASARAVPVAGIEILADAWGVRLDNEKVLHLVVTRGSEQGIYLAYPCRDGILVLRSSGTSAFDVDPAQVEAYGVTAEQLPADVSAWMGVVPAFRFGEPWTVSSDEYAARLERPIGGVSWTELRIEFDGKWMRAVFIPGEGFFEAIAPTDGTVELEVLPAARLFDLILRRIDASLGEGNG